MLETKHISSAQNTLVKKIVLLRDKSKERKKTGLFILEGKRELELAQQGNYHIETVLYNEKLVTISALKDNFNLYNNTILIGSYLKNHEIDIYCAALTASKDYSLINYKKPTAIVVGTENSGLSDIWLEQSTQNIIIPMEGHIDSMNVSVSAAILIFEAKRQRKS